MFMVRSMVQLNLQYNEGLLYSHAAAVHYVTYVAVMCPQINSLWPKLWI